MHEQSDNMTDGKKKSHVLVEQNKLLSEFVHGLAHDLKGFLHNIMGYAELLRDELNPAYIDKIIQLSEGQSDILDKSVALIDAGLVIENPSKIDLNHMLTTLAKLIIPVNIDYEQDVLPEVIGDGQRIQQIFTLLLDNAIKHGAPTRIEIKAEIVENGREIHVCNDGEPLSREFHLETFGQELTKRRFGKGYGLAIIQGIVSAHGWKIRVKSEPMTCFILFIPDKY